MKRLDYLSEITGYEKIVKVCGNKEAERLDKEIRYYEHLPQKRFETAYSSGTIPRIYAVMGLPIIPRGLEHYRHITFS